MYTFEDLAGADDLTWRQAHAAALFDPTIRATIRDVQNAYAELGAQFEAEPTGTPSQRMNALIRERGAL